MKTEEEYNWLCPWCGKVTNHELIGLDEGYPILECLECGKREAVDKKVGK